jgi:hypothetical protein
VPKLGRLLDGRESITIMLTDGSSFDCKLLHAWAKRHSSVGAVRIMS